MKISNNYYSNTRIEMKKFIPQYAKKIIDIGCGEGVFCDSFKKNDTELWGIEINEKVGSVAKEKLNKVLIGDVSLILDELPNNYFDCIIFNDVLEHIIDPYSVLKRIKNKLSSNGVVVCSIPNVRHVRVLRDLLFRKQWKYQESGILDRTHLRFFTKKSIKDMFDDADYQILEIRGINGTKWWKFFWINIFTFGFFSDSRFIQFACVAKLK